MIWIIFALMVAGVLALLLVPLVRAPKLAPGRIAYDLAVYKDQLTEIDRDLDRGVLTGDQGDSARTEIQRRMLAAAEHAQPTAKAAPSPKRPMALAAGLALAVPALSFGLYGMLGSPAMPDQPYAARAASINEMQTQVAMIKDMVAKLATRLQQNPEDGRGWAMLGRSLRVLGESDKARDAYARALPLMPGDAHVRLEYASLLLEDVPAGSPLPPPFVGLMRDVLAIDGETPDALYFVGVAEAQAGHADQARALWTKLLTKLPPESPDRTDIVKQIEQLGK